MRPINCPGQVVLNSSFNTYPVAPVYEYTDYFGTAVSAFDVHLAHLELSIRSSSLVETYSYKIDTPEAKWSLIQSSQVRDDLMEYLGFSYYVSNDQRFERIVSDLRNQHSPYDTTLAIVEFVKNALEYKPGSTTVFSSAVDALEGGAGVCQDFAHLMIALCRIADLPARYVSGYMYPSRGGKIGEKLQGESHAWVEVWLGEWWPVDPTNNLSVEDRHVVVGRGRDYHDVRPLHGIYHGGDLESLGIEVSFTRVG